MIKIAETRLEKKQALEFWEEMRNEAFEIRKYYDRKNGDKYHWRFMNKLKAYTGRPAFLEPLKYKKK